VRCERLKVGDSIAFVCTGGRRGPRLHCLWCKAVAPLLCDWKTGAGKTCDKPICLTHGKSVGPDKDLCPDHQAAYAQWKAQRAQRPPGGA
jgi:hypothetical protein